MSKRLLLVPDSPIRKLAPYAEEAKRKGLKVYHLNIGDPDIKTPEVMIKVLRNWSRNPIGYAQSQGEYDFLSALESYYKKLGFGFVKTENIQVTSGGSEAIAMALFAVCEAGDEVLVFEPYYANYNSYAVLTGVKLVPITTNNANGFHLPDENKITKSITSKTKAILVNNPSNPTGTVYTRDEIDALVNIAKKYNLFLISDEVYREFVYDDLQYVSILEYMQKFPEQMILLDSLSKRYSLCGARLGMLVTLNKEVRDGVLRIARGRLSSGLIDQTMAAKLSAVDNKYFNDIRKEYQKRRDIIFKGLKEIPGVSIHKPEGAFYSVVKLPIKDAEHFCKWLLTDFSYKNETVMLAPAGGFYSTKGLGKDEVRIAYVINSEDLIRAVEIIRQALVKYRG